MKIIDNKITAGNSLAKISKNSNRTEKELYRLNPDLKGKSEKQRLGYIVYIPTSKWSKSKYTKSTLKNSSKNKSKNKVPNNAKSIDKCKCNAPSWMKIVLKEKGIAEVLGKKKNNPRILEYHKASKYWVASEHGIHSWCGSFAAWVMKKYNKKPPKAAYRAASWREFGKKSSPIYGAIGIKSRKGGNHVSFLVGRSKDNKFYYMIGGNQGIPGKVYIKEYPRKVWDTFRVPKDYDGSNCVLPIYTGEIIGGGGD